MTNAATCKPVDSDQLVSLLADPEPMCVALVGLLPGPTGERANGEPATASQVGAELEQRLRENLRPYDELYSLPEGHYAIVLRTLADPAILTGRMDRLLDVVKLPYSVGGQRLQFRAVLGAAIRAPEEGVAEYLGRVDRAVAASGAADRPCAVVVPSR